MESVSDRRYIYSHMFGHTRLSVCLSVHGGVPQGSVLGVLFFNIVMDDLEDPEEDAREFVQTSSEGSLPSSGAEDGALSESSLDILMRSNLDPDAPAFTPGRIGPSGGSWTAAAMKTAAWMMGSRLDRRPMLRQRRMSTSRTTYCMRMLTPPDHRPGLHPRPSAREGGVDLDGGSLRSTPGGPGSQQRLEFHAWKTEQEETA